MAGFPNTVDKLACVQMCDRCAAGAASADAHLHTRRIRRLVLPERWRSGGGHLSTAPRRRAVTYRLAPAVSPLTAHALQPDSTASHRDLALASLCRGSARRLWRVPALYGVLPVATAARWRRGRRVAHAFVRALPGLSAAVRSRPSGGAPARMRPVRFCLRRAGRRSDGQSDSAASSSRPDFATCKSGETRARRER